MKCIKEVLNQLNDRYYVAEVVDLLNLSIYDLWDNTMKDIVEERYDEVMEILGIEEDDGC